MLEAKLERIATLMWPLLSPDLGKDRIEEAVFLKKTAEEVDLDISPRPYSVEQYLKACNGEFLHDEIIDKGKVIL